MQCSAIYEKKLNLKSNLIWDLSNEEVEERVLQGDPRILGQDGFQSVDSLDLISENLSYWEIYRMI